MDGQIDLTQDSLKTPQGVAELNRMLRVLFNNLVGNSDNVKIYTCYGTPESQVAAGIGALALRMDGGADTTLYVKESGAGTSTGWIAK